MQVLQADDGSWQVSRLGWPRCETRCRVGVLAVLVNTRSNRTEEPMAVPVTVETTLSCRYCGEPVEGFTGEITGEFWYRHVGSADCEVRLSDCARRSDGYDTDEVYGTCDVCGELVVEGDEDHVIVNFDIVHKEAT